jgi:DNA mismatch repair protein MSH6
VNYVESDSEGEDNDEEIFHPSRLHRKSTKRQKTLIGTDDEFKGEADNAFDDEGKSGQIRGVRSFHLV